MKNKKLEQQDWEKLSKLGEKTAQEREQRLENIEIALMNLAYAIENIENMEGESIYQKVGNLVLKDSLLEAEHTKLPKNGEMLSSFTEYCWKYPELRFWQALRNWADIAFLYQLEEDGELFDTFYLDSKKSLKNQITRCDMCGKDK